MSKRERGKLGTGVHAYVTSVDQNVLHAVLDPGSTLSCSMTAILWSSEALSVNFKDTRWQRLFSNTDLVDVNNSTDQEHFIGLSQVGTGPLLEIPINNSVNVIVLIDCLVCFTSQLVCQSQQIYSTGGNHMMIQNPLKWLAVYQLSQQPEGRSGVAYIQANGEILKKHLALGGYNCIM
jgi:hypothetical protein